MIKVVSFSLYGNNPKYTIGAIRNSELIKEIYPGWDMWLYHDNSVPEDILNTLTNNGVKLINMSDTGIFGMFWRFLPTDDENIERFIVRDCDSRMDNREKVAVDEWIQSDKTLHIMRDHPYHNVPILGGTWGLKNGKINNMRLQIDKYCKSKGSFSYGDDQKFLIALYNHFKDDTISHDEFFNYENNKPFPEKRKGLEFVGKVFDENENTVKEHEIILENYLKK